MSAADLLRDLRTSGVEVSARDGYLDLDAPKGVLTDELLEVVTKAKPQLLQLPSGNAGSSNSPTGGGS